MSQLYLDFRYSLRQLARSPGFTLVAMLTLALGIGANTAIFSVLNAVLLRPLPYAQPDRLVEVYETGIERARFSLAYPTVADLRGMRDIFSDVAAFNNQRFNFTGQGDPREVEAAQVSPELFQVLGVAPAIGRTFSVGEDRSSLVLLSHGIWSTMFGSDPQVLGKTVTLDGKPYTVIGVMPAGFRFPNEEVEIWAPIGGAFASAPEAETNRSIHFFNVVARLRPGVSQKRLVSGLAELAQRIDAEQAAAPAAPGGQRQMRIEVGRGGPMPGAGGGGPGGGPRPGSSVRETHFDPVPLNDSVVGDIRPTLFVLFGTVALVLLIACANAANLLLARANARRREIVIRQALGASRARIAQQILMESVVLSLGAGLFGVILSYWGLAALLATWPDSLPRVREVGIDGTVLGFTLGVSLLTGLGFGLLPAIRASSPAIEEALREETGSASGSKRRQRAQRVLVSGQLAVALVLLVGAGLLVKSFLRLLEVDPGYDTRSVLAARIRPTPSRYTSRAAIAELFDVLDADLGSRPGVSSVTLSRTLPLAGSLMMIGLQTQRIRPDDPEPFLPVATRVVGPDYFKTMRISLTAGRAFTADDRETAPPVVVINSRLAHRLWPDENAIGKQIPMGGPGRPVRQVTVIGLVGDIHYLELSEEVGPEMYLPEEQFAGPPGEERWVILRVATTPLALTAAVRDAVRRIDPTQPVAEMVSLEQLVSRSTAARRFNMWLISLFAGLAFGLALIGIYGVTAYSVSQRTRELGIRVALGAARGDVIRLLLGEGLWLAGAGAAIGLGLALAATRLLASMLYGVSVTDLLTFTGSGLLLIAAALLATWIPARRAAGVDPVIALRAE